MPGPSLRSKFFDYDCEAFLSKRISHRLLRDRIAEDLLEKGQLKAEIVDKIKELRDKELDFIKDVKK